MSDAEDFEEQLRQEAIHKAKEEAAEGQSSYKDKDGVEYEWDSQKQAWFPKIDDDFIAKYQMSYGCTTTEADSTTAATETTKSETTTESSQPAPDNAYRQYYDYYYNSCYTTAGTTGDSTTTTASNEGSKALASPSTSESQEVPERTQEYIDYCRDYYKFYHGQLNEEEDFDYCLYYEYYSQFTGGDETEGQGEDGSTKKGNGKKGNSKKGKNGKGGKEAPKPGEKRKREDPTWFEMDQDRNTNVYVSGLPADITNDEFIELMSKYGMVMFDPLTKKPKAKLYKDDEGKNKGDGRCCYIKVESVDLALQILDGSDCKGSTIHVEKANFSVKGDYDPKLRKKLSNKQKRKIKLQQEKLFDWRPDLVPGERKKSDKVVVLKNVFNPVDFEKDPGTIQEIRSDIRLECSKFGEVRKVTVYDRHPEGVATVGFKEPEEADTCLEALNGRWFGGRQLSAAAWDGKTKYEIKESELEREARLKKWAMFLEMGEKEKAEAAAKKEADAKKDRESDEKVEDAGSEKVENAEMKKEPDAAEKVVTVSVEEDTRAMEVIESTVSS
ncbi:17S U2 SnRNP complex component HTATSF1-like [Lineus longissimus]|uniref:17S U2 SnRNP complex component HTATSF1-like n=1 Tax=Lineus longissimus TaxID=88925 RepID=UPI002B4DB7B9